VSKFLSVPSSQFNFGGTYALNSMRELQTEENPGTQRELLSPVLKTHIGIHVHDVSSISNISMPNMLSPTSSHHAVAKGMLDHLGNSRLNDYDNSEPRVRALQLSPVPNIMNQNMLNAS
jgi:hypothetical protein